MDLVELIELDFIFVQKPSENAAALHFGRLALNSWCLHPVYPGAVGLRMRTPEGFPFCHIMHNLLL
jgi:hypothetical protein